MKQSLFTMEHARQLTGDTYELSFSGDTSAITAPGQFVNIQLPGKFLRRPISICSWSENALMLLVKVVGEGPGSWCGAPRARSWMCSAGLATALISPWRGEHPVLAGGGIGIAPLYGLARRMLGSRAAPLPSPWAFAPEGRGFTWRSSPPWAAGCSSPPRTGPSA